MVKQQQYQAYLSATQTVAKTKQIVMLYDGVIRCVRQAKDAIDENRIEDRYNLLIKASDIINGLQGALDFEEGGQVARILYNYYSSIDSRLFSIHRTNSLEGCDDVLSDLKQMRDVWQGIDEGVGSEPLQASEKSGAVEGVGGAQEAPSSGITFSA